MLYKKYHRNFVKRFERGTMFKFKYSPNEKATTDIDIIWKEPRYFEHNNCIEVQGLFDGTCLVLIFHNGKLNTEMYVI